MKEGKKRRIQQRLLLWEEKKKQIKKEWQLTVHVN